LDSTQIIYEYLDTNTTNEFYYKDKQLTQQIFRTTSPKDKTTEEIEKDAQGKQIIRRTTIFNEHNDMVERNRYNSENEQETHNHIRYRRKYDAKGNCTESIEFLHNGNPLEAALTEYIYFD
jgi:predicted NUDIX family phosphoesterase